MTHTQYTPLSLSLALYLARDLVAIKTINLHMRQTQDL